MLPVLLVAIFILIVGVSDSVHTVKEGHVGVYWRGGRLLDFTTGPGWHYKVPLLDSVEEVQTTMQTDSVTEIPCGTSGGVVILFDRIEVVNRLKASHVLRTVKDYGVHYDKMWIFDKIHHEINQFCSKHTLREVFIDLFDTLDENLMLALQEDCNKHETGIDIINVRVTKPRIPESVRKSYEAIEAEKAALFLASERAKVVAREAETEANRARIQAEMQKSVRAIELEKAILEKEASKRMKIIESEMLLSGEKAKADAALYSAKLEAEANALRLTPAFLHYQTLLAVGNMSKVYFGPNIPTMLSEGVEGLNKMFTFSSPAGLHKAKEEVVSGQLSSSCLRSSGGNCEGGKP